MAGTGSGFLRGVRQARELRPGSESVQVVAAVVTLSGQRCFGARPPGSPQSASVGPCQRSPVCTLERDGDKASMLGTNRELQCQPGRASSGPLAQASARTEEEQCGPGRRPGGPRGAGQRRSPELESAAGTSQVYPEPGATGLMSGRGLGPGARSLRHRRHFPKTCDTDDLRPSKSISGSDREPPFVTLHVTAKT